MTQETAFRERLIYHITEETAWRQVLDNGEYRAASLDSEGFIHASTRNQVVDTANSFYHGNNGLVLLEIDTQTLPVEVRYELAPNGGSYPHIYGPVYPQAVLRVLPFPAEENGDFHWPEPDAK